MLSPDHVALLFAEPAVLLANTGPAAIEAILDDADRAHVARFRFEPDRTAATASRLLQRLAVGWAADVDPAALRFERAPAGRPQVASPKAARDTCFSASNTRGLVGCAVATRARVGLDVESVRLETPAELLGECLDARERLALEALPVDRRGARFVMLWTLKEAYLKALGIGLTVALGDIAFDADLPTHGPALRRDSATGTDPAAWAFHCLRPLGSHMASVCVPAGHRLVSWWASCATQSAVLKLDRTAA